jgi:hypothetical protein
MAPEQDMNKSLWRVIIAEILEVHQDTAGYIVTIDEFLSDVSGKPQMSDLIRHAANLESNLELRPPKKMIRSAKTAVRAISLYSASVPIIHASEIVKVVVDLDGMLGNYRGLVAPNLNLSEKSYYGTQFASGICSVFLAIDAFLLRIKETDPDTEIPATAEVLGARNVAASSLEKYEAVHIGIKDKLRQAFRQKVKR